MVERMLFYMRRAVSLFVIAVLLVSLPLLNGCGRGKTQVVHSGKKVDSMYSILTTDVNTMVSTGGVIQYRLIADEWRIYDLPKKKEWNFYKGIYIEQFDPKMNILSKITADSATYYVNDETWLLVGHVRFSDVEGKRVFSPRLYWNRLERTIYSQDSIYIVTPDRIMRGNSFKGKDDLSEYTLYENSGEMEYQENADMSFADTTATRLDSQPLISGDTMTPPAARTQIRGYIQPAPQPSGSQSVGRPSNVKPQLRNVNRLDSAVRR